MTKKQFTAPHMEVIRLQAADIIVTSSPETQTFQLIDDEQKAVSSQSMIW